MEHNSREFKLGLGTGSLRNNRSCKETVEAALEVGFRHIDTALLYGNEEAIYEAVKKSSVSYNEIFVSTKVHSKNLQPSDLRESVHKSRESLGVETIDLVYVHWPAHTYDPEQTLSVLSDLRADGTIRHIGLSNFTVKLIEEARDASSAPIFAVQVEMHPFLQQRELQRYANRNGIWTVAHTPLCQGAVLQNDTISKIAKKYCASEAQIALAWLLQRERVAVIPGGRGNHIEENWGAFSINLRDEDVQNINRITNERRCVDYSFAPW